MAPPPVDAGCLWLSDPRPSTSAPPHAVSSQPRLGRRHTLLLHREREQEHSPGEKGEERKDDEGGRYPVAAELRADSGEEQDRGEQDGGEYVVVSCLVGVDGDRRSRLSLGSEVLGLLLRSNDNNLSAAPEDYLFNGATIAGASLPSSDRHMRREFTATVTVRNRAS